MNPLEIVYDDGRLIAVNKPSGLLVIPGRGEAPGETLRAMVERHAGMPVFVVHRLDRGASGLVLFAKDAETHKALSLQFERREVKKVYRALVQGNVARDGTVEAPLREFGSGRIGIGSGGKFSSTPYRVIERLHGATLLQVEPRTGRRHQIRVHLYSVGHPILGDDLYGKDRPVGGVARLMLHACALEFPGRPPLKLRSDPPGDFLAVLEKLRRER